MSQKSVGVTLQVGYLSSWAMSTGGKTTTYIRSEMGFKESSTIYPLSLRAYGPLMPKN